MRRRAALLALGLALLSGCATDGAPDGSSDGGSAAGSAPSSGAAGSLPRPGASLPAPQPGAPASPDAALRQVDPADVRDIYLAFEGTPGSTISVIFAIDRDASGSASGEPALRVSPENGECNPQEMSSYRFAADATPVFGLAEARLGVTPAQLPLFLAAAVTGAMLREGLAATQEDTLPQNVCTRKLWEVLVANQRARVDAAGQG